ncbi:CheR family methyltransferase [Pseudomonas sp. TTU2014-080ASC]|jgi:chemotaxis protein methyltransferase CheR|uniref:CheR family methyltransferase n=1 Tax=Pseudomonas sp. TTU2014-080ASC TaxID=1729724 RepID=UPI0007185231|nr:protein-glutamate O-methyltransferase CheR [Pseudomonas sp. TTU2014-080ASC]KRW58524.1 SAM-dependent methyltransferase [Pseudomonas sp. TTU2014-080ASC]
MWPSTLSDAGLESSIPLNDSEFRQLQTLFYEQVGIQLPPVKQPLIRGRLGKRLRALGLASYGQYHQLLLSAQGADELETAIDLITTHETYFFREPRHFDFIRQVILPQTATQPDFTAWSAACSTGEEAYTLAMLLHEARQPRAWQVLGSDISRQVLSCAQRGLYPLARSKNIPLHYLKRYCLKGQGSYQGQFLVSSELRKNVQFIQLNLNQSAAGIGPFDLILLRNVLIYFDVKTKQRVLEHVVQRLKPGGWLLVGHSEALYEHRLPLEQVSSAIYRRLEA